MHRWDIALNGTNHEIIFEGCKLSGKAKIRVDQTLCEIPLVTVRKIGMFCLFEVDGSELVLKLSVNNKPLGLAQGGVYLETGLPLEQEAAAALRAAASMDPLAQKERVEMGSFLSFVVLTYANLLLVALNASVSFPFSAVVPQVVIGVALSLYEEFLYMPFLIGGIAIALAVASVYLVLYLLARKRLWPVVVALAFVIIDTLILLFLSMEDIASILIDIAFHAWVIYSLSKLIGVRRKRANEIALNAAQEEG
ncbi:MAG: hypothetical protein AAGU74_05220 [Bacillota bacterium]